MILPPSGLRRRPGFPSGEPHKASYIIKSLKKNTKYWVRIRAYKKSGNIIYVSKWVTKNKKTKKK